MRVAIIGAGSAGLAALRHCILQLSASNKVQDDCRITEVICYEKSDKIGGIWVYVPEVGVDKYGLPIHSSMYDNLRTNLPKEVMGYPDFPIEENISGSYLTRTEILNFLNRYCDHFQLRPYIRFLHNVELIQPTSTKNDDVIAENSQWTITVKDLESGIISSEIFDKIMVCNGHYFQPSLPIIEGQDIFQGSQMHSHDYRVPHIFSDKTVVVVGAGPSGMDLALAISEVAKKVILSHHYPHPIHTVFPENVVQVKDILKLDETKVYFIDGKEEKADVIFYCTGYKYSYPFLAKSCGLRVESNMVTPLWKHLLSTENPSLALIGLPFYVCAFSMFDLQVRFVLKFWLNPKELPPKSTMFAEEAAEFEKKKLKGLSKRHFHMMGPEQGEYYISLANTAKITPLPPVLTKLHNESSMRFLDNLTHYREDLYKIIDDYNFIHL